LYAGTEYRLQRFVKLLANNAVPQLPPTPGHAGLGNQKIWTQRKIVRCVAERTEKINDAHGHVVGGRALCRLADTLRIHCREIDTAARYEGDEFVLVLPETEEEAAG